MVSALQLQTWLMLGIEPPAPYLEVEDPAATVEIELGTWPAVVAGPASWCDVAPDADVARAVAGNPLASVSLAVLLRQHPGSLAAESAVYSLLQGGPEFTAWRSERPRRDRCAPAPAPAVEVSRSGEVLSIMLNRPSVHNVFNSAMRDGLSEALTIALGDPSISVEIRGNGPTFCSGGDLDEFGQRPDPATAHITRLTRSPARMMAALAARTTVYMHGACRGGGVELAAFAGRIIAAPDTTFGLPEVSLGLIPGAGGTVSVPARVGRRRAAMLALSGRPIDADEALSWGLIDQIRSDQIRSDQIRSDRPDHRERPAPGSVPGAPSRR